MRRPVTILVGSCAIFSKAIVMQELMKRAQQLHDLPFLELLYQAHSVHRENHDPAEIQKCTLLSIKTGACPEDCSYCPQSAHHDTGLKKEPLVSLNEVKAAVKAAKENGSDRFCMGAAWRNVKDGPEFERVIEMVKAVKDEGLEACVTLGMVTEAQAVRLKEAGLDAYNHNLDTSREFYPEIISTRTYDHRLDTLKSVSKAGIHVCSGGILGLGESIKDRCGMIAQLASLDPQPESVPINLLIAVEGTPLQNAKPVDTMDLARTIAVTRLLIPKARIRLSAGRLSLNKEAQILAFFAGANSIFLGEKLLTRANPEPNSDLALIESLKARSPEVHA